MQIFRKMRILTIFVIVMSKFGENLTTRIAKIPMAMVIVPFATGIFFADMVAVPLWLLLLCSVISLAGVILLTKWWQNAALFALIVAVGALLHSYSYRGEIEYNQPFEMLLKVKTSSVVRKGYTSANAEIEACEAASLAGRKVVIWGDSLIKLQAGDRLHLTTSIHPFRAERRQYAELMHHRGFVGSISLNHRATYEYIPTEKQTLHDWSVARLQYAMDEGDARAVVLAMTTGERGEISNELRQHYAASGASHLLAVSGLHIGIAFMLVNILLLPLVLLRYGNLLRSILAVALIWLYVWLCGMSPSAVRAAIMFSLLQFSLSSLREYVSINILAGAAFIMLTFDTHLLFDISFQLSFVAVAAIVLWAMPIYRLTATRFRVLNALIALLWVGLASTIATMPLVANTFSTISVIGIAINLAVIALANLIVLFGIAALAIPPLSIVAEYAAMAQNNIVEWAASVPYGHFDLHLSNWTMWSIYLLLGVITLLIWLIPKREKIPQIEG